MNKLKALEIVLKGLNLIEASAGTGKTYTITSLVVRLLIEAPFLTIDKILVVTFTNAATAELRDRIRDRISFVLAELEEFHHQADIGKKQAEDDIVRQQMPHSEEKRLKAQQRLSDALKDFDRAAIYTIHSFCQRTLHENAFECGIRFDTELVKDTKTIISDAVYDFWNIHIANQDEYFLKHLQENKVDLGSFLKLAEARSTKPDASLIPNQKQNIGMDYTQFYKAYEAFYDLWSDAKVRDEVNTVFSSHKISETISKQQASKLEAITAEFSQPRPEEAFVSKNFQLMLTASSLNTKAISTTKKAGILIGELHPIFQVADELWSQYKGLEDNAKALLIDLKLTLLEYLEEHVLNEKEEQNIQSYHDLLALLEQGLRGSQGDTLAKRLALRFPAALIDEFQDTDPLQYRIFSRIYQNTDSPIFLIGDPKQAIYSFRGADIFAYRQAVSDAGEQTYTLQTNWRSDPKLIHAVNHLFSSVDAPFVYEEIEFKNVDARPNAEDVLQRGGKPIPPLTVQLFDTQDLRKDPEKPTTKGYAKELIPKRIASHIAQSLAPDNGITIKGEPLHAGQIAILVRKNVQATQIQEALREYRIPSVIQGDGTVFQSDEADQLYTVLVGITEPEKTQQVRAALATDILGLTAKDIDALNTDEQAWENYKAQFNEWKTIWTKRGFIQMMRGLLVWTQGPDQECAQTRLLQYPNGERRITNLLHLIERIHDRARQAKLGMSALLQWVREMAQDEDRSGEDEELRLETDALAVKLVTIHKSKGLQYPVVYCPYLWDGALLSGADKENLAFHDETVPHKLHLAIKEEISKERTTIAERECAAENLRLLYVALTRAQHWCLTVFGSINEVETSPLGYLLLGEATSEGKGPKGPNLPAGSSDEELRQNCLRLAAGVPGGIAVEMLKDVEAPQYQMRGVAEVELKARETERKLHHIWRKSSYSGIVGEVTAPSIHVTPEKDHDEDVQDDVNEQKVKQTDASNKIKLNDFIRNAVAGNCFHEIYEYLDFMSDDQDHLPTLVSEKLSEYGFESEKWTNTVSEAIQDTLETALNVANPEFQLKKVSKENRLDEMEFLFPVAHEGKNLSAAGLAEVFLKHAKTEEEKLYADSLRKLTFGGLRGYVKGFIDLIFRHDEKWYVADYKSNYLGQTYDDFQHHRLTESMRHSHYILQYHVYTLALYRYLKTRLPDADYEDYFGGVYYFYIKGMKPENGPKTGVYFDRPTKALILDLDKLFQGSAEASS